jgi:hypothetical protein
MKYVDNLLDWADDLFTQATMESVNEATMLYVLAGEILGPRPVSVGPCRTASEDQLTYQVLGPAIAKGSEFLMYVENVFHYLDIEQRFLPALHEAPEGRRQQRKARWARCASSNCTRHAQLHRAGASCRCRRDGAGPEGRSTGRP